MWYYKLIVLLFYLLHSVESASILALFSSLSYSDHIVYRGLISRLARNGHAIVMMTPYPGHFTFPDTESIVELDVGKESSPFWDDFRKLLTNVDDYYPKLKAINEYNVKLTIAQLKSKPMTSLFANPNIKFDLVITEADVPMFYAAADKYQAQHIAITTSSGKIHQYEAKGNPTHPFLYPDVNSLNYENLTCWQKLTELNRYLQTKYEYYNNYLHLCEVAAKKIFGLERDLLTVEKQIDMLFVAANPLLIGNRPTVPGIVYTDRLQINTGYKLPGDLQQLLDSATKGAIYFSLGAVQESEQLSPQMLQTLADSFAELPYTVLWKIGNTTMFNKPDNVVANAWFPQQQVLAHPNLKAFITHGGARSLEEAIFNEVPIVGFPIVKSRRVFIREITKHGTGEILDPYSLEKDIVTATISLVASNEDYKKEMSKLNAKVFNNEVSGPDRAVWWTEYILRHGGGNHLRSPAVGVTVIQYLLLDLIIYFVIGTASILWISLITVRYVCKRRARYIGRHMDLECKFKAL